MAVSRVANLSHWQDAGKRSMMAVTANYGVASETRISSAPGEGESRQRARFGDR